ncbi:hypothetical protein E2C01_095208 [Portunus trituberculatus]|uniref:Uncharacterized protein n=1 Tax=Portunus trituberculatus TaxID=210409 RepID=A0A5B7JZL2_PORTR|nr:hypothetical protein [Portunus trituberculatus]MPC99773.1 hypothetical protein [Portunus trituberculatus]
MDEVDKEDSLVWDSRNTRGHGMKLKKTMCRREMREYSFPNRSIEIWNNLNETVVQAINISDFKAKLDDYRHGNRTAQAYSSFPVKHN